MNLEETWQAVLGELEVILSQANFTTWFKNTQLHSVEDKVATISVPSTFAKEWLENKYHGQILETLRKLDPEIAKIKFAVSASPSPVMAKVEAVAVPKTESPQNKTLNPDYTFQNFIVGNSNQLAQAAALAVSQNPGKKHNPLFIYGGVGLGKTHLAQAIGNEILKTVPKKKVIYVPCEGFTNEFIQSIREGKTGEFKKTYRDVDVLLVDDIHFLSRKEGSQEEFFHTFNSLHQNSRQIIITSDRPPRAIPDLEERLSSRFGMGMIADIRPPDLETRQAILRHKALERTFSLPEDILEYIAHQVKTNIRDLEGALNRVVAYCDLNQISPSLKDAIKILENIIDSGPAKSLSPQKIISVVSDFFNLKSADLLGNHRYKETVYPRQITMYLLRHEMNFSFPKIGKELGGKDHTTIMHGCKKIEREIIRNTSLQEEINLIKEKLYLI